MEFALFHPEGGYYSNSSPFGASGDYFTSPAAHPAFGALLALQMNRMWEVLGQPSPFFVVEMGAGNGLLARDLLSCAAELPAAFADSLGYVALDRYPVATGTPRLQRLVTEEIPLRGVVGCLVSNELVDSFPVHRFQLDRGELMEVYVTVDDDGHIVEVLGEPSTALLAQRLSEVGVSLEDGFRGEVSLQAAAWMKRVSAALESGFVVTIDYGHEAAELYSPARSRGTVQTHYRHTQGASPYQRIGRQDISAQVDFSHLVDAGRSAGLSPLALLTQAQYLAGLGFQPMLRRLRSKSLQQRELDANLMAMRELVKPEGLGGFKVLIQEKGTGVDDVSMLAPTQDVVETLEPPLLSADHMPLLEGRYPHLAWQPEEWPLEGT